MRERSTDYCTWCVGGDTDFFSLNKSGEKNEGGGRNTYAIFLIFTSGGSISGLCFYNVVPLPASSSNSPQKSPQSPETKKVHDDRRSQMVRPQIEGKKTWMWEYMFSLNSAWYIKIGILRFSVIRFAIKSSGLSLALSLPVSLTLSHVHSRMGVRGEKIFWFTWTADKSYILRTNPTTSISLKSP